jgi:hypothetical protein
MECILSISGLEVLLRNQHSKVKQLILEQVGTRTVGLHAVLQELGHNTTVTHLAIRNSGLSLEDTQQLKVVLHQNSVLQHSSKLHLINKKASAALRVLIPV